MSMNNFNDNIGNRIRDLPVFNAAPQPLRHQQRAPNVKIYFKKIKMEQTVPWGWKMANEQMDGCMNGRTKEWI
jgi:hypothetical protein